VAITEPIQLLRIDREDTVASFEEGLDDCASWHFDADGKAFYGFPRFLNNPVQKLLDARPTMAHIPFGDLASASP
jgi:hypothetical protein